MKFDPVTIKDIAKALNLSTSTVSRALRDSYEISSETKKLVLEYAKKINYRPNPIALSLKDRSSKTIGVVVSEIANDFFSEAIDGIESIAYSHGYQVIITQSHESAEREKAHVQHHASRSVDGLLISLSCETTDLSYLADLYDKGLPIVFFDRVTDELNTHKVIADNYEGAFRATEHLIYQGYKNIAHIAGSPLLSITKERLKGYTDALEKYNITFNESLVKYCDHGGMVRKEIETALGDLYQTETKPDAIFTAGDRITIFCFGLLKGLKLPKKIGFIGFTNTKVGELFAPSMSVIKQPAFEMGQTAIELLIQMIESKKEVTDFQMKILNTEMVIRKSSLLRL
jgi:LacI family transcriptional regulator